MGEMKDKATQKDRRLEQGNDQDKDQGLNKEKDKDKDQGVEKNTDNDIDKGKDIDNKGQDSFLPDPSSPALGLGLAPQIHADSCHYCAGGLFRAANLLLFDVINHRQQCTYT